MASLPPHQRVAGTPEHFVQFYETDDFLMDAVSSFIGAGLEAGEACIVFATQAHRALLEERLRAGAADLDAARLRGEYIALDASEMLAQFMVDGWPAPERFVEVVGSRIVQAARNGRPVRVFGEMVSLLVTEGNQAAAVHLEVLWNILRQSMPPFSLFCAYAMRSLVGDMYRTLFAQLCEQHSKVMPTERYVALADPDERLRAIALLQQKADSLEAEIAERKRAEEHLRISENRYRRLFEASTDGILLVDPGNGAITATNLAMTALLGYTRDELLGQELWQIGLFADQAATLEVLRALREQEVLRYETLSLLTKGGERRYVELVSILYQANAHQVIQCNLRDITDRKRAEEALRVSEKELERQREAFVGMITHELRTPLTALQGNIQLAQRRLTHILGQAEQMPAEQQETLEAVLTMLSRSRQQLRVQHRLIDDLVDVASIQEGKLKVHLAPCDLSELVYETVQDYQAAHPSRLITLELPEQDAQRVEGDRDRIQQVLGNYLANALKFSPESEPVHVGLALEGESARVWVQDHGPGLTREQQERIWERFYQSPQTPVQSGSKVGLGLGLYICQHLMSRQAGQVGIESTPGGGATFWFQLPLVRS
jgi:PAS domain S-box-containing protein